MTRILAVVVVAALFGATPPLAAHHSTAMYTGSRTISGKVLKFEWTNPHAHVYIETKDDTGATVVWELLVVRERPRAEKAAVVAPLVPADQVVPCRFQQPMVNSLISIMAAERFSTDISGGKTMAAAAAAAVTQAKVALVAL